MVPPRERCHSVLLVGNFISKKDGTHSVGEELSKQLAGQGYKFTLSSRHGYKALRFIDMVWSCLFARCHVALVDVYSGLAFRWAEVTTRILHARGIPIVLTLRGGNLPAFSHGQEARLRKVFKRASLVTAPSSYLQRHFSTELPSIAILPNPVDRTRFAFRHRTNQRFTMLWVRAYASLYNPTMAVKAMIKLHEKFPQAKLRMIGSIRDQSFAACEALVLSHGLESVISLEGPMPNELLGAVYDEADIFLNTTTIDNMPVTLLEALSAGLAIVSTNVGGVPDLIDDGVNGLLVDSDDVDGMVDCVSAVFSDTAKLAALSRHADNSAREVSWDKISTQWCATLRGVVALSDDASRA